MANRPSHFRVAALSRFARKKASHKANTIKARFLDQAYFVGALVQSPRQTGAIAPTSRQLAQLLASHIDLTSSLPVIELGAGTGSITRVILATGLAPERFATVEFDPRFCRKLKMALPAINVIEGDAFDLKNTLDGHVEGPLDCVISGLPLLNFSEDSRRKLLNSALDMLAPGRPFVQFSYGVRSPVEGVAPDVQVHKTMWVWKNLPPARVWTYTRIPQCMAKPALRPSLKDDENGDNHDT